MKNVLNRFHLEKVLQTEIQRRTQDDARGAGRGTCPREKCPSLPAETLLTQ